MKFYFKFLTLIALVKNDTTILYLIPYIFLLLKYIVQNLKSF
ncbi:hypothetical protein UCK_00286 [Enterococcus faecalis EnGen0242]|nr:hypothetical protein UCK_00322 [Enterococcus faecalis EnGen0242]EOI13491.1 hypothetical protein UCK_00286 [Enterococcus faecalis EnGen0242]